MVDHVENQLGRQVGHYRLVRLLGQGGFANIYLGEHIYLKTFAAIKLLRMRLVKDELQSFLGEARTIASLAHSHIVRVLDFGVEDDAPFLVMEYAPNGTLRDRHPKGSCLHPSEVVSYVKQVADALQYAHDRRIIHRDIKPANMLLGSKGEVLSTVRSASARYHCCLDNFRPPKADAFLITRVIALSPLAFALLGLGLETTLQLVPSQCSVNVLPIPTL